MFDFVGKRHWFLLFSIIILIPGIVSLIIPPGLRPGIEFTSGTLMTLDFEREVDQTALRDKMADLGHPEAIIQRTGEGHYLVRTKLLQDDQRDATGTVIQPGERQQLINSLQAEFGPLIVLSFDAVSPIIAQEIAQKATLAVVVSSFAILLYVTYAFRSVSNPFRYGVCAILTLVQEVILVLGIFSIMGKVLGTEVDSMFISAMLTVVGFSVQDTIVVFDRIRENSKRMIGRDLGSIVNVSLLQTGPRSLTTNLTVVLTLVALLLFGGQTIRDFVLTLLIGFIAVTYSSIFVGSQLLVMWENGELFSPGKWFRGGGRPAAA